MSFVKPRNQRAAEVIPSINVLTFEEAKARVKKIEPYVTWCHFDITDGIFSKHRTWRDPRDVPKLSTTLKAEAHLMVAEPEKVIDEWCVGPVKRVIVHLEAARDPARIIKKCRDAGIEIGFAINPETQWEELRPWFEKIDMIQLLAVSPGPSGQKIHDGIYEKIAHVRNVCPSCIIEVDGGMNDITASLARSAGADIVVAGTYIFNAANIADAIASLSGSVK